ncbi:N-acetylneuraminate synthase family protein [Oceanispirochaeta sp.]|jgi:sialic acid synthase SpsE/mannose-6-phosphate isomerase-like protein (cupin superfamily)|uniref:N-acetylneuraminate synthase family protein n=1 Tax=Oceanispirochaeta sp. TaxID=2035350 RepID=UPI00260B77D6|nr:N-acetylneuraminate synthase family protein [Oceanispirochaeta sp.]MDA3955998.1 N-acetylneuraminate synthase family protein [Oceanispirochaeta sp.]
MKTSIFDDLFIFEMANNHQGDMTHGFKIIDEMAKIRDKFNLNAAVKFQYRDLSSFIHKDFINRTDVNHVPRLMSTRLSDEQFEQLLKRVKERGLKSMSTPFDEISVDRCVTQGMDYVKVASCSADDWPLLEKVSQSGKPVIISTGGLQITDIDSLVSFFRHKHTDFALMHCVALYPSPNESLNMDFLDRLIHRYPEVPVGFSGHEDPENTDPVKIAVSKKAVILERHVGVPTDSIKLNGYSMNPQQVEKWISAALDAKAICGDSEKHISEDEKNSLLSLKRGVYASKNIKKGEPLSLGDVYFAMPCQKGQTTSGELGQYRANLTASKNYEKDEPVYEHQIQNDTVGFIRSIVHEAQGMLYEAGIRIPENCTVEISHHKGLQMFRETGAILINIVNREYCKKLMILFPGQKHPVHLHKKKEETFHLLWGDLQVVIEGTAHDMTAGEILLVERNADHSFSSRNGAIFEEISTSHLKNDSYYTNESITRMDLMERKTILENW